MEAALGRNRTDLADHFHKDFVWKANFGCGTKRDLEGFERGWYSPWRDVFGNQLFKTEHYMEDGEISEKRVSVDFASVMNSWE